MEEGTREKGKYLTVVTSQNEPQRFGLLYSIINEADASAQAVCCELTRLFIPSIPSFHNVTVSHAM